MTMAASAPVHLGIDIGTSSCKVVAVDSGGNVLEVVTGDYPLYTDHHGWSEQDPEDWWQATDRCVRDVVAKLPGRGSEVVAIGLSGQMHGLVALDERNRVLRRAILWNDQRCEQECVRITEAVGGMEAVIDATNNRLITGFTAGKIAWLRDHEPALFAQMTHVLNPKDFLRWRITGDFVTDVSEASGTGLFDVRHKVWSPAMVDAVGITADMLPSVVESMAATGTVCDAVARNWNISQSAQVYGGGGDAVIQTASMGVTRTGEIGVTLGTAGIIAAASDFCPDNKAGNVQVSCYNRPGYWHVMGVSLSAAGGLHWLAETLQQLPGAEGLTFPALIDLAKAVPPGADGLLFLPYLAGERAPHYAPSATAAWVGLSRRHGLGHLVRSVIEGALLNMKETLETFGDLGIRCDRIIASGGATRDPFWLQTMADIFGAPVVTMTGSSEGGAYGAAIVAGVGAGTWDSLDDALDGLAVSSSWTPDAAVSERYARVFAGHRKLFSHFGDIYHDVELARCDD
jgi:xylulokinase